MKKVLFYAIQFSWGALQNLVGLVGYLALRPGCRQERFHNAFVTYIHAKSFGGVSFGIFIFVSDAHGDDSDWMHDTRIHEYGHSFQSLLLGPLYLLIIGLPSAVWCNFPLCVRYRKKRGVSYNKLYCEGWANLWGLRFSGETFRSENMLKTARYGRPL